MAGLEEVREAANANDGRQAARRMLVASISHPSAALHGADLHTPRLGRAGELVAVDSEILLWTASIP